MIDEIIGQRNFPLKSIHYLKSKGFDISSIGADNQSVKDNVVMDIAMNEERTILTFDRDYGELIFKHNYRPRKGVIYRRVDEYKPEDTGKIIEELITKNEYDFDNALTVLDKNGIRQRKY